MFRIFDAHAHVFPDKIAKKAVKSIGDYYKLAMVGGSGTCADLLRSGEEIGVERFLIHSTATKPDQVESINDFIASAKNAEPRFVGFGTLHPGYDKIGKEIARIESLGLRGIKLHPDFQGFSIDDEEAFPIYEMASERLPILIHMGDENTDGSSPARLARVIDRFPKLTLIAAHLGGYTMWDEAVSLLGGSRVFFDTSSSLSFLEPDKALAIMRKYGTERVLFGSDYPMWRHGKEFELLKRVGLTDDELRAILWDNAASLIGA